jgi:hypothetical protein
MTELPTSSGGSGGNAGASGAAFGGRSITDSSFGGRGISMELGGLGGIVDGPLGHLPLDSLLPGVRPLTTVQTTYTVQYAPDDLLNQTFSPMPPSADGAGGGSGNGSSGHSTGAVVPSRAVTGPGGTWAAPADGAGAGGGAGAASSSSASSSSAAAAVRMARVNVVQRIDRAGEPSVGIFTDDPDLAASVGSNMASARQASMHHQQGGSGSSGGAAAAAGSSS